ncbi:acrB/AcrD/AcrF family protein, partial [Vibrio parahaemolyticus EKP-008]|jgi:hypothetical protein
VAAL